MKNFKGSSTLHADDDVIKSHYKKTGYCRYDD